MNTFNKERDKVVKLYTKYLNNNEFNIEFIILYLKLTKRESYIKEILALIQQGIMINHSHIIDIITKHYNISILTSSNNIIKIW